MLAKGMIMVMIHAGLPDLTPLQVLNRFLDRASLDRVALRAHQVASIGGSASRASGMSFLNFFAKLRKHTSLVPSGPAA